MNGVPVSPEDPDSVRLLLVEDEEELRELLVQVFVANPDYATHVETAGRLDEALALLQREPFDAVLLDLGLPDSSGLRTARTVLDAVSQGVAVVVLTGQRDTQLAAQALSLGSQDYVVKDELSPQLCTRVVRYGVTRARLLAQLADAREGERRERELRRYERMAVDVTTTGISAAMLGSGSLRDRAPSMMAELRAEYRRLLVDALDEQVYRTEETVHDDLRSLARVLGYLGAGPRDVIELHSGVLRALVSSLDPVRASAAVDEGRVLVLQLMGRLVTHYRERSIGGNPVRPREADVPPRPDPDVVRQREAPK